MKHSEYLIYNSNGTKLFGQIWEPDRTPIGVICLVHGLGEHSGRYGHLATVLTDKNYALLAQDLRGHGRSEGKRGHASSYEALLQDIDLLLKEAGQRFPSSLVFLYGHSLGGNLVLNYVLRHKPALAGVIATSPWLRLALEPPALQVRLAGVLNKIWPSFTQSNGLQTEYLCHDELVVKSYEQDTLVHNRISARLFLCTYEAGIWAINNSTQFNLPLLLMHGSDDKITSAEASSDFAQGVSGVCTYKIWDGFFHETHNEPQKQQLFEVLIGWLRLQG